MKMPEEKEAREQLLAKTRFANDIYECQGLGTQSHCSGKNYVFKRVEPCGIFFYQGESSDIFFYRGKPSDKDF